MIFKKCIKCGAMVEIINDCKCDNCGIQCCEEAMQTLIPNTAEASVEKHKPTYEINGDKIKVTVNHVMEQEHYIEFIALCFENNITKIFLKPGEIAQAVFPYIKGSTIFAYCNKHELWLTEVE